MQLPAGRTTIVKFDHFEVDFQNGELRRGGLRIRVQEQPLCVLRLLLERHGQVVTRQELQQRLWPADTFVDFEAGLNAAIKKLRAALEDSATQPRYIETLARRGYRFIAPITNGAAEGNAAKRAERQQADGEPANGGQANDGRTDGRQSHSEQAAEELADGEPAKRAENGLINYGHANDSQGNGNYTTDELAKAPQTNSGMDGGLINLEIAERKGESNGHPQTNPQKGAEAANYTEQATQAEGGDYSASTGRRQRGARPRRWNARMAAKAARAAAYAAAGAAALLLWWNLTPPAPRLRQVRQITYSGALDYLARPVVAGGVVYYVQRRGSHWELMQSSVRGGASREAFPPSRNLLPLNISADGAHLLLGAFQERGGRLKLWEQPLAGGSRVRLGVTTRDAIWSEDGHILYTKGHEIWQAAPASQQRRRLATLPAKVSMLARSPRGGRIACTVGSGNHKRLWVMRADGSEAHPMQAGAPGMQCCGAWSASGRYFLFAGVSNLWAIRETGSVWRHTPAGPFRLSYGPEVNSAPAAAGAGQIIYYGSRLRERLEIWDAAAQQTRGEPAGRYAEQAAYSPDGRRMAYVDGRDGTLWTSRADGRDARQLTQAALTASWPRWSPDGRWIAFYNTPPDKVAASYVIRAGGGRARRLLNGSYAVVNPDWAPDGRRLAIDQEPARGTDRQEAIYLLDRRTGRERRLAGSRGLWSPRWSPDGRWIAAYSADQRRMMLYDTARRRWRVLARGRVLNAPEWSRHGRWLYFQDLLARGEPVYRQRPDGGGRELVTRFDKALSASIHRCGFYGLTPAGDLLVGFRRGDGNLYRAELRAN